jgi:hypothetical protein
MKLSKDKVSFSIRLAAFQASGRADPPPAENLNLHRLDLQYGRKQPLLFILF